MNIYFLFIDHRKDFVEWVGRVALVRFVFHHERILERERVGGGYFKKRCPQKSRMTVVYDGYISKDKK